MTLPQISPERAKRLLDDGAILVDIREAREHALEKIPSARLLPLSNLDKGELERHGGKPIIFHCKSGMRTKSNSHRLAGKAGANGKAFIMEGGINAWKKAGLPVESGEPLPSVHRQVQFGLMSVTVVGAILGLFVSPLFFAISILAGASLIVARRIGC